MTLSEKVASVHLWRHQIRLPGGIVTPGNQDTFSMLSLLHLPKDLTGLTVLDVGCSDGFYSFECEKRGALRVLAVDNFSSVYIDSPVGFHVAREILSSKVEFQQADLLELSPAEVGQFDIVLFLGVLYHLRDPLIALERLAALCKGQLIMETLVAEQPRGRIARWYSAITGYSPPPLWMEFYPNDEINRDPTTWWAPTVPCAEAMLLSCGFSGVRTIWNKHQSAVLHAFATRITEDLNRLLDKYGDELVAKTCTEIMGRKIEKDQVISALESLSTPEFGQLRQRLAEARGKHWHQIERWEPGH